MKLKEPIYIAGPMTGLPERNYPAFRAAEATLRDLGYTQVVNPCHEEDDPSDTHPWEWYIRRGLTELLTCNTIVLLPDWTMSKGAALEVTVGDSIGCKILGIAQVTE